MMNGIGLGAIGLLQLALAISSFAVEVTLTCSDVVSVDGQKIYVVSYPSTPVPKTSRATLCSAKGTFQSGKCTVNIQPGTYRFDVLYRKPDGPIVALTTGKHDIADNMTLDIKAQAARPIRLAYEGRTIPIVNCQFRVAGTMEIVEVDGNSPLAILTPDETFKARIIGEAKGEEPAHAVVWVDVDGNKMDVEITDGWHSVCKFQELPGGGGATRNATATLFTPEARRGLKGYEAYYRGGNPKDLLAIPMTPKTTFITNRKYVDMWYTYETSAGEFVSFCRQQYLLSPQYTFKWGGALSLSAYARLAWTWSWGPGTPTGNSREERIKACKIHALLWGASLLNAEGHRVNNEEISVGLPGDSKYPKHAQLDWKQKLVRRDGKSLTLGSPIVENGKKSGLRTDSDDWQLEEYVGPLEYPELHARLATGIAAKQRHDASDLFDVKVSYKLNGKAISQTVNCRPWVRYKSTHVDFLAPLGMVSPFMGVMDRLERTWFYGSAYPCNGKKLEQITVELTGCRWAGFSKGGAHSQVQLGMAPMRGRYSPYGCDWGPAHELMHSWGYDHGDAHNKQISRVRGHYRDHHIALADNPDYEPEPVKIEDGGKETTVSALISELKAQSAAGGTSNRSK